MQGYSISYGSGTRGAYEADSNASTQLSVSGVRAVEWGSDPSFCAHIKDDGHQCGARPANGTPLCVGHLRSLGSE